MLRSAYSSFFGFYSKYFNVYFVKYSCPISTPSLVNVYESTNAARHFPLNAASIKGCNTSHHIKNSTTSVSFVCRNPSIGFSKFSWDRLIWFGCIASAPHFLPTFYALHLEESSVALSDLADINV